MVAATNVSGSGTTMAPSGTTMAGTTPLPVLDGPAQFDVRIGVDSGPKRVERVKRGSDVTLNISNPNAADEFHVHTVDMEQKVAKGAIATFNFKVDANGTIEVESHVSNTVIITIEVV